MIILNLPNLRPLLLLLSAWLPQITATQHLPIHLGHIFSPPQLTILAWLPTQDTTFCYSATDASALFSIQGTDALKVHDYFSTDADREKGAWISREGKRWAECFVTPLSVSVGSCYGIGDGDCVAGHKYRGNAERKWTCWVIEDAEGEMAKGNGKVGEVESPDMDFLTGSMEVPSKVTDGAVINEKIAMFTAGVTGR